MVRVKICGITNWDDARVAVEAGADAVGFVFYAPSPRAISPKTAAEIVAHLPPFTTPVGVFVDEDITRVRQVMSDCGLSVAQLHGNEPAEYCRDLVGCAVIKAVRLRDHKNLEWLTGYRVGAFLLDAFVEGVPGGTGVPVNWELASTAKLDAPIILAGGLTPDNVRDAIRRVRPYGVDVSSGVERSPGKKDHAKVRAFIAAAESALDP